MRLFRASPRHAGTTEVMSQTHLFSGDILTQMNDGFLRQNWLTYFAGRDSSAPYHICSVSEAQKNMCICSVGRCAACTSQCPVISAVLMFLRHALTDATIV